MSSKAYLGDAVSSDFDGEYIILETGDANHQRIYLDHRVFRNLVQYAESIGWSVRDMELKGHA